VEQYAVDFSAQATRIVLTPEEFDAAFITRDGEADGAAVQAAVGFAPGTFRVLRCKPLPQQQQQLQQQLQQQPPLQSSSHASVAAAAVKAEAEDREEGTDSTDAASSPSSSSDATPPLTAAPASKAGGRAPTKASAR